MAHPPTPPSPPSLSPSDSAFPTLICRSLRSSSSCPTLLLVHASLSLLCLRRQGNRKNPERPSPKAPSAPSRAAIPVGSAGRYVQQTRCLARMFQTMAHYSSMLSIFTDDFLLAPRAIVPCLAAVFLIFLVARGASYQQTEMRRASHWP